MESELFAIERIFNAPVPKVWKAITDKAEMKKWYFDVSDFQPVVGFEFTFEGRNEDRVYIHLCKITEVEPNKRISYTWKYKGHPGESVVSFILFDEDNDGKRTRFRLVHAGLESFPDMPDFARKNFEMGWTDIIGRSLKEYIEKQ